MNQNSCFTIHPFPDGITPLTPLEDLFEYEGLDTGISILEKFTIPADSKLKRRMLIQLKKLGIDYNSIFPDLTGLCKQIKVDIFTE